LLWISSDIDEWLGEHYMDQGNGIFFKVPVKDELQTQSVTTQEIMELLQNDYGSLLQPQWKLGIHFYAEDEPLSSELQWIDRQGKKTPYTSNLTLEELQNLDRIESSKTFDKWDVQVLPAPFWVP